MPMTVAPGVNLTDLSVGDVASVHYTRPVTFVVGSPNVPVSQVPATSTVGQVAQTPGGIGPGAATIVGRVVKLDGPTSFDAVNANGGAVYTIKRLFVAGGCYPNAESRRFGDCFPLARSSPPLLLNAGCSARACSAAKPLSVVCSTRRKRVKSRPLGSILRAIAPLVALLLTPSGYATAASLTGSVSSAGQPVGGATVTLYAAAAGPPTQLAQGTASDSGAFTLTYRDVPAEGVLYVIAQGGTPKAAADKGANNGLALLAVLGTSFPNRITVNELTTVASAFTAAQFINSGALSGNTLGLRIAAGNTPNLVDLETGGWGKVIVDPGNSTWTTALANLDTLGSLISAFATVANDDWRARFLKAATPTGGATPKNTLEAMAGIARTPWANPQVLYALFDEAYPQPKDGSRRAAPFAPYLAYSPPDFTLALWFGGGGSYSNGNMVFDAEGNMWCGQNWLAGSQSGVRKSIGGGLIKFSSNGTALSPPITGFTGMGVDGIGWGTAVALDKVWLGSFNGAIGVHDFQGNTIGKESDIPFAGKTGGLMGVSVAANGDVWIADGTKNQLLQFPGGRLQDGRIVKVAGLKSPFGIAIDAQNHVWVTNSQSDTVARFPADDPSKVETFKVGIGARGVALDSKGNLWVSSLMSPDFPMPKIPDGVSIMEQFALLIDALGKFEAEGKKTGIVSMIRPDGTQLDQAGFTGAGALNAPWGVAIDGNDDVWVASGLGRGVALFAGANPEGHAAGVKPGDLIHFFQGGTIAIPTIGSVDPAGNVWVANNWDSVEAATAADPFPPTSTQGGGSGFTIIYGVAAPVKTPLLGTVRKP